ncbi:MAG: cohesin domain-containing protein [Anaerolineae bacterium]
MNRANGRHSGWTCRLFGALVLLCALWLGCAAPTLAEEPAPGVEDIRPRVELVADAAPAVGAEFDVSVRITVDGMTRGAQCDLVFDPRVVQVLSVQEGDWLKTWAAQNGASTLMMPNNVFIDNENGKVPAVGVTIMGAQTPLPGFADVATGVGPIGSGVLLVYRCRALAPGGAGLQLANIMVLDRNANKITGDKVAVSVPTVQVGGSAGASAGGATTVPASQPEAAPSPAQTEQRLPWELIIVGIGALAMVGVVAVAALRKP